MDLADPSLMGCEMPAQGIKDMAATVAMPEVGSEVRRLSSEVAKQEVRDLL